MKRDALVCLLLALALTSAGNSPAESGQVVVLSSAEVRAMEVTGATTYWSWALPPDFTGSGLQLVPGGNGAFNVLVTGSSSGVTRTYCLRGNNGVARWHLEGIPAYSHVDAVLHATIYTDPVQFPQGPPNVGGTVAPDVLICRRHNSGSGPSEVLCVDSLSGEVVWTHHSPPGDYWAAGFVPDKDGDGIYDVVVRSEYLGRSGGGLYCLSGRDGATLLWQTASVSRGGVTVPDVNGDGQPDYVAGECCYDDRVMMLDGFSGAELWGAHFKAFDVLGIKPIPGSMDMVVAAQGSSGAGGIRRFRADTGQIVWSCDRTYNNQTLAGLVPTPTGYYVISGWRHRGRIVCVDAANGSVIWDDILAENSDHVGVAVADQDGDGYGDLLINDQGTVQLYSTANGTKLGAVPAMDGAVKLAWMPSNTNSSGNGENQPPSGLYPPRPKSESGKL